MQIVHILAIASVLIGSLLIDLRLLGLHGREHSVGEVWHRYIAFVWFALPILLITDSILIIGEPARSLANLFFQLKMLMLATVIGITLGIQRAVVRKPATFNNVPLTRRLAMVSIALWIGIVCAGRWIAYTY